MAIIRKQFSTFAIEYVNMEITIDNFHKFGVDIETLDENNWAHIRPGEMTYHTALQFRSDDEQQVRDAIDTIVNNRRFWADQLASFLK